MSVNPTSQINFIVQASNYTFWSKVIIRAYCLNKLSIYSLLISTTVYIYKSAFYFQKGVANPYFITGASSSATDKSSSTPTPTDDDGGGQFLRLPKTLHDQDASLETIDLNDDPNDQTLERFLRGKNILQCS